MKVLLITIYVCCFFARSENYDVWYTIKPVVIRGMDPPRCVRLPEREYIVGFLVIHQTN